MKKARIIISVICLFVMIAGCSSGTRGRLGTHDRGPDNTDDANANVEVNTEPDKYDDIIDDASDNEIPDFNIDERLFGAWKNSLEDFSEYFGVDTTFMETTWTFRESGVALRTWEVMQGYSFTYYWHLEDNNLYLYSYTRWGEIINWQPDNDMHYIIEWIDEKTISLFNLGLELDEPDLFFKIDQD
ncbi:MAG: hypothetical protein FWE83_05785 [Oscillospiraceae bacterium]|nr:hypothetical protein [Oscillospiraceae bacterium]